MTLRPKVKARSQRAKRLARANPTRPKQRLRRRRRMPHQGFLQRPVALTLRTGPKPTGLRTPGTQVIGTNRLSGMQSMTMKFSMLRRRVCSTVVSQHGRSSISKRVPCTSSWTLAAQSRWEAALPWRPSKRQLHIMVYGQSGFHQWLGSPSRTGRPSRFSRR